MLFKRIISGFLAATFMIACVGTSVSAETGKRFPTTAQLKIADVNNDAQINAKDATAVLKMSVNLIPENGRGDVNNDGSVNAKDATQILRYVVGMTSTIDDIVETSNNYRPTSTTQPPAAVNNPDTDGDRLPDEYEVITLHTDPTSKDTDDNGTTDDNEDFDSDNLTNYEEYLLGTNPYKADTDEDGLTDGDEVNIYNTNPLKYDTDGDGVIDGDEVLFSLNPNDLTDGNTIIKQSISEDELRVNKYNDNFKISIDVEASNNVKRFIDENISRYSGILSDNRAIIGLPISVKYNAGTIKSGTITFRLDDKFVDSNSHFYPELGLGIERYGIFCYDEEVRTIVPLPCNYDEENKTITVDAQYMGNLMIIDYESLMFDLGVKPEEIVAAYGAPMAASFMAEEFYDVEAEDTTADSCYSLNEVTEFEDLSLEEIENILNFGEEDENVSAYSISPRRVAIKSSAMRQVDLVLVVDTTGSMGTQIATVKRNLSTLISKLRADGISLYVSVVDYRDITCDGVNSTKVNNNSGVEFYSSIYDISKIINSLSPSGGGDIPETAIDGLAKAHNLSYRSGAAKFAFLITDANYKNQNNHGITDMADMARMLKQKNIRTSVVTYSSYYNTYENLVETTEGKLIPMNNDFCDAMYEIICNETPGSNVVIANNIVSGFFKEPLVKGGTCDTDGDTLSDSDEVDWNYVKKVYKNGTYDLYTWKELCSKTSFLWFGTAYTDGKLNPLFKTLSDIEVIPATSNPFSADTDKDYYPDNVEVNDKSLDVLESNAMFINDEGICDADFHNGNSISTPVENKYTDGVFEKYFETHDDENRQERARYSFTRRPRMNAEFSLTPKSTSFYKLEGLDGIGSIYVTYKGLFGSTKYVYPEEDGTYLLKSGKEYTIKTFSVMFSEYKFTVEQDNWEYAPNGCIQTVKKYSDSYNPYPVTSRYFLSEGMLHAIIADIVGTKQDLSDIDYIDKIMNDLGYDRSQYIVTGGDVSSVIFSDILLIVSVYSLGGGLATEGIAVVTANKYAAAGAVSTVGTVFYDVIFSPNINLIKKYMGYLEKLDLEDTLKKCQDTIGEYNIYCSNCVGIGLNNMWEVWGSAPYVRKVDGGGTAFYTEQIDFSYTARLRNKFGWK